MAAAVAAAVPAAAPDAPTAKQNKHNRHGFDVPVFYRNSPPVNLHKKYLKNALLSGRNRKIKKVTSTFLDTILPA